MRFRRPSRSMSLARTIGLLACVCACGLHAQGWEFTPRITVSETYTDNVTLAPEGQEEEEVITQVSPGFSLFRDQGRILALVNYQMQNLFYAEESDFNQTFHQLDAVARTELLRERFFIDLNSTISQQLVDGQGQVPFNNNLLVTDNRTDATTVSVSPFFRQDIGSRAETSLRYRYGIVDFDDNDVGGFIEDNEVHTVRFLLGSELPDEPLDLETDIVGQRQVFDEDLIDSRLRINRAPNQRFSWLLTYENERIEYEDSNATDRFEIVGLAFDYQVSRTVALLAAGGYEDNEFERSFITEDVDGSFWEAGFRWEPGARDLFELRYGQRFFGDTYDFVWFHFGNRFTSALSYTTDVTTGSRVLLDAPGRVEPIATPSLDALSLTARVFVQERFAASATIEGNRNTVFVEVFSENRDFDFEQTDNGQQVQGDEQATGADIDWEWRFGARTALLTELQWVRQEFDEIGPTDGGEADGHASQISVALERLFGSRTTGLLEFSHTRRDADDALSEYRSNAITIGVVRTF